MQTGGSERLVLNFITGIWCWDASHIHCGHRKTIWGPSWGTVKVGHCYFQASDLRSQTLSLQPALENGEVDTLLTEAYLQFDEQSQIKL